MWRSCWNFAICIPAFAAIMFFLVLLDLETYIGVRAARFVLMLPNRSDAFSAFS
jgi:maltodextrin utilization protein YvdJ